MAVSEDSYCHLCVNTRRSMLTISMDIFLVPTPPSALATIMRKQKQVTHVIGYIITAVLRGRIQGGFNLSACSTNSLSDNLTNTATFTLMPSDASTICAKNGTTFPG